MADSNPDSGCATDDPLSGVTPEESAITKETAGKKAGQRLSDDRSREVAVADDQPFVERDPEATPDRGDEHGPAIKTTSDPQETFQALANQARTDVLEALYEAEMSGDDLSFSELQTATDIDTSAGFAYHLRQLVGPFVEKSTDGYRLTFAGRQIAQSIAAGTFTDRVNGTVRLDEPCPLCASADLWMKTADNDSTVACEECETVLMRLPFPPASLETHGIDELPRAFNHRNRHRLAILSDGVCPDCGGAVETVVERPTAGPDRPSGGVNDPVDAPSADGDGASTNPSVPDTPATAPVLAEFTCRGCGQRVRSPLTLTVLNHPEVVSFYHDHGEVVGERPLWNVGTEWREGVLSTDPWCVRVSSRLDGEVLDLFVDGNGEVQATRREPAS